MTWSRVELQGPPPACRLDLAVCVVELRVPRHGLLDQGSGDLSSTSGHAKEVLERELKPGSASSRDSWTDVNGEWTMTVCMCVGDGGGGGSMSGSASSRDSLIDENGGWAISLCVCVCVCVCVCSQ